MTDDERKELVFWLEQSGCTAAALTGTMTRQDTAQFRAARALERLALEKTWVEKDLRDAKELLRRASDELVGEDEDDRIDAANHIDAFLDMIRCAKCGERIQHAGFLGDTGQCSSCDAAERKKEEGC